MENGRELMMRVAEPIQQGGDTSKSQYVLAGRQHRQPVKLRLNGRVSGSSVVRHVGPNSFRKTIRHPELVSGSIARQKPAAHA
jgi:TolB-like protein